MKKNSVSKLLFSKKLNLVWFVLLCVCTSCLDEVKLKLRQETRKIIVEGLLTDNKSIQYIRLYYTNPAVNAETIDPVKGALIEVIDNENNKTIYRPNPNNEGIYKPENPNFSGIAGKSYSIKIKLNNGFEYKSKPQLMLNSVPIDKLGATFIEKNNVGFLIDLDFTDPKNAVNYYRWKGVGFHQRQSVGIPLPFSTGVCCDRCWVLKEENSVNVFTDVISNGSQIKGKSVYFSPFYLIGKHFVEVQQLVINRDAYQFWIRYDEQVKRSGSIFDALPASITGNVINTGNDQDVLLGYFEVASVSIKRIIPEAGTDKGLLSFNIMSDQFAKPPGDCMLSYPNSTYAQYNPPGW